MSTEAIKETIQLNLDSSGIPKNSLAALITQLEQVEARWRAVDAVIATSNQGLAKTPRQVSEIQAQLRKLQPSLAAQSQGGKGFSAAAIASALGFDPVAVIKHLDTLKKEVKDYHKTAQQFRNLPSAARFFADYESKNYQHLQKRSLALKDILRPTVGSVHGTGALKVEGIIPLAIPGAQVQASVIGPITVAIPGSQVTVAGAPSGVASGAGVVGSTESRPTGGGRRSLAKAAGAVAPLSEAKLAQIKRRAASYTENEDLINPGSKIIGVTRQTSQGSVTTMYGETDKGFVPFKEVTRGKSGQPTPEQVRRDLLRQSVLFEKQQRAEQLRAEAARDLARQGGSGGSATLIGGQAALAAEDARINATLEKRRQRDEERAGRTGGKPPAPKPTMVQKAIQQSFSMQGMAAHTIKVAGWAMAAIPVYAAAYKPFELAAYSMQRMLDVGMQMGHLSVIFRQQGGSVKQLTDDILGLAAAQGRSSDEAMESATEWARLGLTRSQVNQAVTVSMMAANVAQMHTTETTKQLMSLLHIYHLQVAGLSGELGKLVYVSQHWNVTLEDLFKGLDAAGPQARQMGMSLGELSGIIAGMVGKTGQSGAVVGNTVKYILQQFNRAETQQMLRGFGVEATTSEGTIKKAPQVLREMFIRYQGMNLTERQSMTTQLAGRFHGSRFTGMMDSYIESQKLAIDSQLNLNSAQTANAAILDTLQNKLAGLKSEWDRLIYSQATMPSAALGGWTPMQLMTGGVGGITNAMRGLDQAHQSLLTPIAGAGVVGGSMAARAILMRSIAGEAVEGAPKSWLLTGARSFIPSVFRRAIGTALLGRAASTLLAPEIAIPAMFAQFMPKVGTMLGAQTPGGELDSAQWFRGDQWAKLAGKYEGTSAAAAGKADLYRTTQDLLGLKNTDSVAQKNLEAAIIASANEMNKPSGTALTQAFASGDVATARKILEEQRKVELAKEKVETSKKLFSEHQTIEKSQKQAKEIETELAKYGVTAETPKLPAGYTKPVQGVYGPAMPQPGKHYSYESPDLSAMQNKLADLNKQIADAQAEKSQIQEGMEEQEGTEGEQFLRKKEYLALLEQQKGLMEDISHLAAQGGSGTPLDQLSAQVQGAQMQADVAQQTYETLQNYTNEGHPEGKFATEAARQGAIEARAKADALNSPQMRMAAGLEEGRDMIYRRTDMETQGVGYTETEKLQNQRGNLQRDLNRVNAIPESQRTPADNARAYRDSVDLKQTEVKLAERLVELRQQEKQIMLDANRESAKAMLLAGPGELLKRLYVAQAGQRRDPMSTGEFMSWSPEMKQIYYASRGGEAGAKNREEQWLLGGDGRVPRPAAGEFQQSQNNQAQIDQWRQRVGGDTSRAMAGLPQLPLPGDALADAAKVSTLQVTALGSAAGLTANILAQVNGALTQFMTLLQGGGKQPLPGPRLGLATGFSLGAQP